MPVKDWKESLQPKSEESQVKAPSGPTKDWKESIPAATENPQGLSDQLSDSDTPFLDGMLQGGTFGAWDEIMSRVDAMTGDKSYRENWDSRQKELDRLRRAAPWAFNGGEAVGAIGSSFLLPGAGAVNLGKGGLAALKASLKLAAMQGGLYGLGTGRNAWNDPNYVPGAVPLVNATQGAVEGVLGDLFGKAVGIPIKAAANLVAPAVKGSYNWGMKNVGAPLFKVGKEAAKELMDAPHVYRGEVKTLRDIVDNQIQPMLERVGKAADDGKAKALSYLTDRPALSVDEVRNIILGKMKENRLLLSDPDNPGKMFSPLGQLLTGKLGADMKMAKAAANGKNYLTEKELSQLYNDLKIRANYDQTLSGAGKEVQSAYQQVIGAISEVLGQKNKDYGNAMKPVAQATKDLEKLKDMIRVGKGKFTDFYEVPKAGHNILRQVRKNEPLEETLMDFVNKYAPDQKDIIHQIKRINNEKNFNIKPPSSHSAVLGTIGAAMGATGGDPSLGAAMAVATAGRDALGPALWKQLAVMPSRGGPGMIDALLRPAAVQSFVTPSTDPEYIGMLGTGETWQEYVARKDKEKQQEDALAH
jgi:hypothetical protein